MATIKNISSIDQFKSQVLPSLFERESQLDKKHNEDYGNKIALSILSGIEDELKSLKKRKKKTKHNNV